MNTKRENTNNETKKVDKDTVINHGGRKKYLNATNEICNTKVTLKVGGF